MPTIRQFVLVLVAQAAAAAARASSPCPRNTLVKSRLIRFVKSLGDFVGSTSGNSTLALRGPKAALTTTSSSLDVEHRGYHDVLGSQLLPDAMSNRLLLSDYTVSLHVFLPTLLPLMDDQSKSIFERVALEFIDDNIDNENLPIESVSNLQITDQELAWQSIFDGLTTPGVDVFFRADAVVSGDLTQNEIEESIQMVLDSKSTIFHEMFDIAQGGLADTDRPSSTASPAPSAELLELSAKPTGLLAGHLTPPAQTPAPAPSTATVSPALSAGPPSPTTSLMKNSDPSAEAAGSGSKFVIVGVISTVVGTASFVGILLLCARYVRKSKDNDSHNKPPLETTFQTEDKEGSDRSEASLSQQDHHYLQHFFPTTTEHSDDRELSVSDNDSEFDDHHPHITLAALVKDSIDTRMFFQCDESAVMSSIASSTNSSGSDDSANYSQKSTITLEDLDNFDNEIRQSEC